MIQAIDRIDLANIVASRIETFIVIVTQAHEADLVVYEGYYLFQVTTLLDGRSLHSALGGVGRGSTRGQGLFQGASSLRQSQSQCRSCGAPTSPPRGPCSPFAPCRLCPALLPVVVASGCAPRWRLSRLLWRADRCPRRPPCRRRPPPCRRRPSGVAPPRRWSRVARQPHRCA